MFQIDGTEIEEVNAFTYLGKVLTKGGRADEDIIATVRKANSVFAWVYPVWRAGSQKQTKNIQLKSVLQTFWSTCGSGQGTISAKTETQWRNGAELESSETEKKSKSEELGE